MWTNCSSCARRSLGVGAELRRTSCHSCRAMPIPLSSDFLLVLAASRAAVQICGKIAALLPASWGCKPPPITGQKEEPPASERLLLNPCSPVLNHPVLRDPILHPLYTACFVRGDKIILASAAPDAPSSSHSHTHSSIPQRAIMGDEERHAFFENLLVPFGEKANGSEAASSDSFPGVNRYP